MWGVGTGGGGITDLLAVPLSVDREELESLLWSVTSDTGLVNWARNAE